LLQLACKNSGRADAVYKANFERLFNSLPNIDHAATSEHNGLDPVFACGLANLCDDLIEELAPLIEGKLALEIRDIDNTAVRESQIRRLEQVRAARNEDACRAALAKLTEAAKDGTGNLLALAIDAARERATVGEISDALEDVYGRYRAMTRSISGVYGAAYKNDEEFQAIWNEVEAFAKAEGRRPRMLVSKLGQDGHDRGAKVVATAFADVGFDIDLSPMFSTPEEVARQAIENDVHVVGASSLAAGHKTLVPELVQELRKQGADDIVVIAGGVIPRQDYEHLYAAGVKCIFGPGTPIPVCAREVLDAVKQAQA